MASQKKFELTSKKAQLILNKFKLESLRDVRRLQKGMINDVFSINDKFVVKVNTGHPELAKLKKEKFLYLLLKKKGIPVPEVYALDETKDIIPYSFIILEKVRGHPLSDIWPKLSGVQKKNVLIQLASILARAHKISFKEFGENFKGEKDFPNYFSKYLTKMLKDIEKSNALSKEKLDIVKKYFHNNPLFKIRIKSSLIHGNFIFDNFLVEKSKIQGIVDWEWGRSGHNEEELAQFLYRVLEMDSLLVNTFKKYYSKIFPISKDFHKRIYAYNLLYYLRVLPEVKTWTHRLDKQREYSYQVDYLIKRLEM